MKRLLAALAAACLAAQPALAASPKVEASIKTFQAVGADPARLKIFCDMTKLMGEIGDKDDPAGEAKIDGYIKQLGPEFEQAWAAGEDLDENSEDGKALDAALDQLADKCT